MSGLSLVIVAALATWEAVEVWHHSQLFATWRARTELWEGPIGRALGCPFCLSVWAALAVVALLQTSLWWAAAALAAARLANLGNDAFRSVCRTPRYDKLLPADPPEDGESGS